MQNNTTPHKRLSKQELAKRAAAYVRMSTDLQKYSTENQIAAIEKYAKENDLEIVRTYADEGKSGLSVKGRDALQNMIADVEDHKADYGAILVLDITRWGRFQNTDESAYYEHICRRNDIDVHYVAEQFKNDGSFMSSIYKTMKRGMAGEYPRELSRKVFAGSCRLINLGFRQGGNAGYGLRRMMLNEQLEPKMELKRGDRKSLQTDRVILVPGPPDEVEHVRWMYRAFVDDRMQEVQIAAELNKKGIKTDFDRLWTRGTVHEVLTNEKYIGHNVYNRRSYKLKEQHVKNPPDQWVSADNAFEAIVEPVYFLAAQHLIQERCRRLSDDEMLLKLKTLYEKHGCLSGVIIDAIDDMPSSTSYAYRFGGLISAYKRVGYEPGTHWLVHIPNNIQDLFTAKLAVWVSKVCGGIHKPNGAIHVKPIDTVMALSRYCMKGVDPYHAKRCYVRPVNQGVVIGKRVTISRSLGPTARKNEEVAHTRKGNNHSDISNEVHWA